MPDDQNEPQVPETTPTPEDQPTWTAPAESTNVVPEQPTFESTDTPVVDPVNNAVPSLPEQEQSSQPAWDQPPLTTPDASEIEAPTQPVPGFMPSVVAASPQKPNRKKGLLIGIIIAVIVVLLAGGTAFAYKFWYQNPEKVVTDAFVHAIEAKTVIYKGNVHVVGDGSNVTVAVTGDQDGTSGKLDTTVTFAVDGQNYTVNGSGLIDKSGDLYVKLAKLDDLANAAKKMYTDPAERAAIAPLIDQLKAKIDGTWIKISSSDLKDFSDSYATTKTCVSDAIKKFKDDSAARNQLTNLYEKHQFITIEKELGAKNGSLGYNLSSDDAAAKAFANGLKSTDIYKQLHNCDSSFTINTDDLTDNSNSKDTGTVTVWVSRWTHELTNATIHDTSDGTTTDLSIEPTFNQPVKVEAPAKSTTLSQLESDINDVIQAAYTSAYSSSMNMSTAA